jgi:thiol-disulfide isomerase/thioredoxin
MKCVMTLGMLCALAVTGAKAQSDKGPTDPKAQKTYAEALGWVKEHKSGAALDSFRKADKQDGGHCQACQSQIINLGLSTGDFKAADEAAQELIGEAKDPKSLALAHMKQDDAAKAQFEKYVAMVSDNTAEQQMAQRYADRPDLVRARLAPNFAVTTTDGQRLSLEDLEGKVVLIDFWATWCGPCREALPHIREIAQKFQGQPLVVLSVSLDKDESKWKDFVAKNGMTWMQYRDGDGDIARLFAVHAIPHTFTIDSDGVLQDEHIGDGSIEGKLKKLCARARQLEEIQRTTAKLEQ